MNDAAKVRAFDGLIARLTARLALTPESSINEGMRVYRATVPIHVVIEAPDLETARGRGMQETAALIASELPGNPSHPMMVERP